MYPAIEASLTENRSGLRQLLVLLFFGFLSLFFYPFFFFFSFLVLF